MGKKLILITGGAGFIGSHVTRELLSHGYSVRILDSLVPQVHGAERRRPGYLAAEAELVTGDIRDPEAVSRVLNRVDAVIHLVALVGVGQSMYQIAEYTSVNNLGTAVLLEALSTHPVEKLLVASSMSIYGEGQYADAGGKIHPGTDRTLDQLRMGDWEIKDPPGQAVSSHTNSGEQDAGACFHLRAF